MTLPHHSLVVWQRADDLFVDLHAISRTFPSFEQFELARQLRRSAFSVPVNIVEGTARFTDPDKLHFLQQGLASLAEVGYCIHVAVRLGYLPKEEQKRIDLRIRRVSAPLRGLMKSLGREHP
ncbi:MAG: four helix bundle protein [Vicinamibacterales bacterium]